MIWLFDLDNTLVDREAAFRGWATDLVAQHGGTAQDLVALLLADGGGHAPKTDVADAVRTRLGLSDAAPDLIALMRAGIRARIGPYDGVPAMLDELRAGGDLVGVVTNGTEMQQRSKLALTGLSDRADAVVVSDEVGIAKPDPRIFGIALDALGAADADRAEIWMVGDAAHADVAGAQAAGIRTAWLSHGRAWDGDTLPDLVAHGPLDAVAAVQSLVGQPR